MAPREYRPSLSLVELVVELQALFDEQQQIHRLICRYLADLADLVEQPVAVLTGYGDVYHLARCQFGLSFRATRERIRVGRALRNLPGIDHALVSGKLSYSRVREVTRVASSRDEAAWLQAASELSIRALERRVAEASAQAGADGSSADAEAPGEATPRAGPGYREQDRAKTQFLSPEVMELRMTLPPDVWALLERALQGARRASEKPMSDVEALAAVARDALAQQDDGSSDVRRTVVLYECRHCHRTELDTGGEPMDLSLDGAASFACGAKVIDLEREGRLVRRGGTLPASLRRAVLLRDRDRCRVPGCGLGRYVDVHHLDAQSHGGEHSRSNCVCLCERHHRLLHAGQLWIEGDADAAPESAQALRFFHADGEPLAEELLVQSWQGPIRTEGDADALANSARTSHLSCADSESPVDLRQKPWDRPAVPPVEVRPTTSSLPASAETHGGSPSDSRSLSDDGASASAESDLSREGARILAIMGHRGGWLADSLCDASDLSVSEVAVALTTLELSQRVVRDLSGRYAPLA